MLFGLCNAPGTLKRLMKRCMGELNLYGCLIYLDYIIVFSSMSEEHLERLQAMFSRLELHNLKLKAAKCVFKSQVVYLGHVVSEAGNLAEPAKIVPKTIKEVRQFLGFIGYYHQFVKGFTPKSWPLNDLLVGHDTNPKASNHLRSRGSFNRRRNINRVMRLIDKLTLPPVLAYADCRLPFLVPTDASSRSKEYNIRITCCFCFSLSLICCETSSSRS